MRYSNDSFVAMLLTMALSPDREEYARPFSTQELQRVEDKLRPAHIGTLANADIGALMLRLEMPEEEAYRAFTLLNRSVQLSYTLEKCADKGIEVTTRFDAMYPHRLLCRMESAAPPIFYHCGRADLLDTPMLAVIGISGVRTDARTREAVETLVRGGTELGYTILTGGEPGVSRVVLELVRECGGNLVEILAGDMTQRMGDASVAALLAENRAALISFEHPEALFTIPHAIARSRAMFALAEAAFVFNTDGKRGEMEAIRGSYCDWIYAWTHYSGNKPLIARGAVPFDAIIPEKLDELARHWKDSRSEQLDMYAFLDSMDAKQ